MLKEKVKGWCHSDILRLTQIERLRLVGPMLYLIEKSGIFIDAINHPVFAPSPLRAIEKTSLEFVRGSAQRWRDILRVYGT